MDPTLPKTPDLLGKSGRCVSQKLTAPSSAQVIAAALIRVLRKGRRLEQAVATAHTIARVVYRMLKYQVEYEPLSVNEYQRQYEAQQIEYLKKRAAKFGFQLVPT